MGEVHLYRRITVIEKTTFKSENFEQVFNNPQRRNIKIFGHDLEKKNIQGDLDLSKRVAIRKLKITGQIVFSEALEKVEESINEK